jgi:hypothetical protein
MNTLHVDLGPAPARVRAEGPRAEALRAAARYARLAAFSAACALYVLVRYVVLRPRQRKRRAVAPR